MIRPGRNALVFVLLAAGCAHAPPPAPVATEVEVLWPEPPSPARVRLAFTIPDPRAPEPRRSTWRRILDAILGLAPEDASRPSVIRPFGVAMTEGGELLIADPDLPGVARVGTDHRPAPIACAGRDWKAPMAIAAGPGGAIFVADSAAAEVVRVDPDGRCATFGRGALERPTGLAFHGDRVYVADPPRHEIRVFTAAGQPVGTFGTHGDGDGQLSFPTSVATGEDGSVYVVDALNFRIAHFSSDGAWLGGFGVPGDRGGEFARPKGIAVAADGRVYVSDAQRDAVLVFRGGAFEYAIGASGSGPGDFTHPAGLAASASFLLVADSYNGRVQAYEILGGRS